MTCIVGLIDNGITYIGADSLGSNGYSKIVRKDKKVFKLKDTSNAIIGYTSSFRMGQLLMYADGLIDKLSDYENKIDHEYLVTKFIPRVINLFENGGYSRNNNGEKTGGDFLLGYKDKLYHIEGDFQVGESMLNYDACGCGKDFALGSLATTEKYKDTLSPQERIRLALQSATEFSVGVAPPYYILNTENDEVVEYKD
jgi:ATP-dependent protease HslVU (ClpYQ) peptidase subunit